MSLKYENSVHLEPVLNFMIIIPNYRASVNDTPHTEYMVFNDSDRMTAFTVDGNTYLAQGLGKFMSITSTRNELTPSTTQVSLSISGIPNSSIWQILNNPIKGSAIRVWRKFIKPGTEDLAIPGDALDGRFFGVISHYSIQDTASMMIGTSAITLICDNIAFQTFNQTRGRQTNPGIQKQLYPGDTCFDRVAGLIDAAYNFGAPNPAPTKV